MIKEDIETMVSRLEDLIKTKSIVGEPIINGNITIIPIMSASFGFGVGGGEGNEPNKGVGKGSGAGAGAKINATALIVIQEGEAKIYSLSQKGTLEKIAEMIPEAITKFHQEKSGTDTRFA